MKLSALAIIAAIATVLGFSAPNASAMPRAGQAPITMFETAGTATPVHYRRYRHRHRGYRRYRRYRRYYRPRRYYRRYRSHRHYHCHRRFCHTHRHSRGHHR